MRTCEIAYFDFNIEKGELLGFEKAKELLMENGINLRDLLAKLFGGIHYSRSNYLKSKHDIESYELSKLEMMQKVSESSCEVESLNGTTVEDSIFLGDLNLKLKALSTEQLMDKEVPLVFLFADYAQEYYSNDVVIMNSKNQFGECFSSVGLKLRDSTVLDLTELVFRTLYPDFDRDDYDDLEDVQIDILKIKVLIDYYNSKKRLRIDR